MNIAMHYPLLFNIYCLKSRMADNKHVRLYCEIQPTLSLLMRMARDGQYDALHNIINQNKSKNHFEIEPLNETLDNGAITPLSLAIRNHHIDIVELLLVNGAQITKKIIKAAEDLYCIKGLDCPTFNMTPVLKIQALIIMHTKMNCETLLIESFMLSSKMLNYKNKASIIIKNTLFRNNENNLCNIVIDYFNNLSSIAGQFLEYL